MIAVADDTVHYPPLSRSEAVVCTSPAAGLCVGRTYTVLMVVSAVVPNLVTLDETPGEFSETLFDRPRR